MEKGESDLSSNICLILLPGGGHHAASCLTFLLLCFPHHDGMIPSNCELNKLLLTLKALLARPMTTTVRKTTATER